VTFELAAYGPMDGRTVVVTGGTSGIGYETARALSAAGAQVVIVSRNRQRTLAAAERIASLTGRVVQVAFADFSELGQVRGVAAELLDRFGRIDVLVNNAGAIYPAHQSTVDGFELTWQVDYLAPFLLTNLLAPALAAGAPSRVITVSSDAHLAMWRGLDVADPNRERTWSSFGAYSAAKLANIMFAAELARRWAPLGITSNAVHPGIVRTGFGRGGDLNERGLWTVTSLWSLSPQQGADTLTYLASSPQVEGTTGQYFYKRAAKRPSRVARDVAAQGRLWDKTAEALGLDTSTTSIQAQGAE
jgi:NAD(P)-dependent dehydrogenase (short-subunit alcohol dehydrogenase family)